MKNIRVSLLLAVVLNIAIFGRVLAGSSTENGEASLDTYRNSEITIELPFENSWFYYVNEGKEYGLFPEFSRVLKKENSIRLNISTEKVNDLNGSVIRFEPSDGSKQEFFVYYLVCALNKGGQQQPNSVGVLGGDEAVKTNTALKDRLQQLCAAKPRGYDSIEALVSDLKDERLDAIVLPESVCTVPFLKENGLNVLSGEQYDGLAAKYSLSGDEDLCAAFFKRFVKFCNETEAVPEYRLRLLGLSPEKITELRTKGFKMLYEEYPAVQYEYSGAPTGLLFSIFDSIQHNTGAKLEAKSVKNAATTSTKSFDVVSRVEVIANEAQYFLSQSQPISSDKDFVKYMVYSFPVYEVTPSGTDIYRVGYSDTVKSMLDSKKLIEADNVNYYYEPDIRRLPFLLETGVVDAVLDSGNAIENHEISQYGDGFIPAEEMELGLFIYIRKNTLAAEFFDLYFSTKNYIYPWFGGTQLDSMYNLEAGIYRFASETEKHGGGRTVIAVMAVVFTAVVAALFALIFRIAKRSWEKSKEKIEIISMADRDELTGAYNLRKYNKDIAERVQRGDPFALIQFDIDRFKSVNDTYGHDVGDVVIKYAVEKMQESLRKEDVIYRKGGDEFMVIFDSISENVIGNAMNRFMTRFASFSFDGGKGTKISLKLGASFGIALFPQDGEDIESLFISCDEALYQSKKNGRGRYTFFSKGTIEE